MKRLNDVNKRLTVQAVFFLLVFTVTFLLTALTPLVADDFNYAFVWGSGTQRRVTDFFVIFESMRGHRQWTHGRVFASGWTTLFMMWPKWSFNLANAAVASIFFAVLLHYFRRTGTNKPVASCCVLAALYWVCMPSFGQVFLWLDGATNYFWGVAFAWTLLEVEWTLHGRNGRNYLRTVLLLPLAFAVGAWSEHISFAIMVVQFLYIICYSRRDRIVPVREWLILLASGFGYLYLMFAPSMLGSKLLERAKYIIKERGSTISVLLSHFWWALLVVVFGVGVAVLLIKTIPERRNRILLLLNFIRYGNLILCAGFGVSAFLKNGFYGLLSSTPTCFFLLLSFFSFGFRSAFLQKVDQSVIFESLILFVGGISALIPFAGALYIPARGFCAPVVFAGIATVQIWRSVKVEKQKYFAIALSFCFMVCFILGMSDLIRVYQASCKRNTMIADALAENGVLIASPYPAKTRYSAQYGLPDLAANESWPKDVIKDYYGLREIIVMEEAGK